MHSILYLKTDSFTHEKLHCAVPQIISNTLQIPQCVRLADLFTSIWDLRLCQQGVLTFFHVLSSKGILNWFVCLFCCCFYLHRQFNCAVSSEQTDNLQVSDDKFTRLSSTYLSKFTFLNTSVTFKLMSNLVNKCHYHFLPHCQCSINHQQWCYPLISSLREWCAGRPST